MTSLFPHDLGQLSNAEIKTEDCSAQTNTAVNRDAVTEHEHAQDLPETSGFGKETTGEYENIQYKQEPTWYWHTAVENSSTVDTACTCNCNNTADVHDTNDCVTVAAECRILCTGVCFPGEDNVIKDTCKFTVCVHKSLFSRGVIDRVGVEDLKTNIERFLHTTNAINEHTSRHNKTESSLITKYDCDTAESKATGFVQTQHKHNTCMRCGNNFICKLSVKQHVLDHTRPESYLCEKCTAVSQTWNCEVQVNPDTIPDKGENTERKTAVHSPMFKHTPQQTHMGDGSRNGLGDKFDAKQDKPIHNVETYFTWTDLGKSFIRTCDNNKHSTSQAKENSFQCTECVDISSKKCNPHNHRQARKGDQAHVHTYCEQTLTKKRNLSKHNMSTLRGDYDQASQKINETITNRKATQYNFRNIEVTRDELKYNCKMTAQCQNQVDNDTFIPVDLGDVKDADCVETQVKLTSPKGDTSVCKKKISYLCEHCGKTFDKKNNLKLHLKVHTEERLYKCSECENAYKYKHALKMHMRIHTGEKPYKCTYCNSAFIRRDILNRHLRSHTGERPYTCSQCGKTYKHHRDLKMHIQIHTGQKPFNCTHCHKTFTRKYHLTYHIRTHTGEKPYNCTHCDKMFSTKRNLTVHIRTHTGEKPHKCTHCNKAFVNTSHLTRHIRTNTGEKPYTCNICGNKFIQKVTLRRHTLVHTEHYHSGVQIRDKGLPQIQ